MLGHAQFKFLNLLAWFVIHDMQSICIAHVSFGIRIQIRILNKVHAICDIFTTC